MILPIVRIVLIIRTKRLRECCIFVTGKQDKLLGRHLCLVETSRATRSDYSYTPMEIIRTPRRDYPDSTRRLSRPPTDASAAKNDPCHLD